MRILVLIVSLLFVSMSFAQEDVCRTHQCMAIVDVGSTGSRLYLYTYDLDETQTPIEIKEIESKKITPGFATLEPNSNQIENYLNTLFARPSLSTSQQIPVYFYATAGMRLLTAEKQKLYYEQVKQWFSNQAQWQLVEAKTIPGRDEGMYAWLTVNYQLNTLKNNEATSIGVMDMGGASVQVVFSAEENITLPSAHIVQFKLYGKSYTLISYSVLGLGQTLTQQQFLNEPACFAQNYPLIDGGMGVGDAQVCQEHVSHLVNDVHFVNKTIAPMVQINNKTWYTLGGLSYLATHPVFNIKDEFTIGSLFNLAQQKLCSINWANIESMYGQSAYNLCFNASYYSALIENGYGLSREEKIHLAPQDSSWTLGVVLTQQNHNN